MRCARKTSSCVWLRSGSSLSDMRGTELGAGLPLTGEEGAAEAECFHGASAHQLERGLHLYSPHRCPNPVPFQPQPLCPNPRAVAFKPQPLRAFPKAKAPETSSSIMMFTGITGNLKTNSRPRDPQPETRSERYYRHRHRHYNYNHTMTRNTVHRLSALAFADSMPAGGTGIHGVLAGSMVGMLTCRRGCRGGALLSVC